MREWDPADCAPQRGAGIGDRVTATTAMQRRRPRLLWAREWRGREGVRALWSTGARGCALGAVARWHHSSARGVSVVRTVCARSATTLVNAPHVVSWAATQHASWLGVSAVCGRWRPAPSRSASTVLGCPAVPHCAPHFVRLVAVAQPAEHSAIFAPCPPPPPPPLLERAQICAPAAHCQHHPPQRDFARWRL